MFGLDSSTVIVTGASKGLGKSIATTVAAVGADVAVNYPNASKQEAADRVCEEIRETEQEAIPVQADVTSSQEVCDMFDAVESELGTPTVVVNNAGIGSSSAIEDLDRSTWEAVLEVDLTGVFLCSQEAVRRMKGSSANPSRIINVASQLAFKGASELTHYCAAKGGVISFTRALAREVAPEITVNAIAPGPMTTEMLFDGTSEEWREQKQAEIPLNRFANPEEVAPTVAFLASDAGTYYTGQVLSPDGGDAMH